MPGNEFKYIYKTHTFLTHSEIFIHLFIREIKLFFCDVPSIDYMAFNIFILI